MVFGICVTGATAAPQDRAAWHASVAAAGPHSRLCFLAAELLEAVEGILDKQRKRVSARCRLGLLPTFFRNHGVVLC